MSEVAILLSDLQPALLEGYAPLSGAALPALAHLCRFGRRQPAGDWRSWLARWLGRADLAGIPDAVLAAAAHGVPAASGSVWLVRPVHLQAGMRSVHLGSQGLLRLTAAEAASLALDFNDTFAARGFQLLGAQGGVWLAQGPAFEDWPATTDPARLLGQDIAGHTPSGAGAAPLMRLGAELEMWLHAHPLNEARVRARRPALSTLWFWGGGVPEALPSTPQATDSVVFGDDPALAGLCAVSGAHLRSGPATAAELLVAARTHPRVAAVVELCGPGAALPEQLRDFDARLLAPLRAALGRGPADVLHLVSGGQVTTLRRHDALRFWRRSNDALAVLR